MQNIATDYNHRFHVDGPAIVEDAFFYSDNDPDYPQADGEWHTVLVGGLRAGGQGVYALDITDPTSFSTDDVLWEFTDVDTSPNNKGANGDSDLGYSFSEASIVKMADGKWAAIFGNGYSNTTADGSVSTTGTAVLYIVDIVTGELLQKIDTGVDGAVRANGLSSPAVIDIDGDHVADYAYAGDLEGNLWKFDLTANSASGWKVAYKQGSTLLPLFSSNADQPITARPSVTAHPYGGLVVLFGTGKYFETNDNNPAGQPTQSVYGIIDDEPVVNDLPYQRASLLPATI